MLRDPNDSANPARAAMRTTIQDVADALDLTKGTVSRALNGYADISDRTRLRVMRKAEAMGYRPMAQAQAIRTGRARSVGLVLAVDEDNAQKPFLTDFLDGVSRAASAAHWTLTVATATSEQDGLETMFRLVGERKADGFILPRTRIKDPRVALCRSNNVPFVLYGRVADPEGCAWYDIRGEAAMQAAVARLHAHGHHRIAFVNGGAEYNYSVLRLAGYQQGLAQAGLKFDLRLVRSNAMTDAAGATAARDLLSLEEPPTAIVFALDAAALGAFPVAAELGLTLGQDLSIIAYDGIPEGAYAAPGLTTFGVDTRVAGQRLTELLINRIRGDAPENLRELADATLVVRASDGAPALSTQELARKIRGNDKTHKEDDL